MKVFTLCNAHKEGVLIVTSISHSIWCALHTLVFTVAEEKFLTLYHNLLYSAS